MSTTLSAPQWDTQSIFPSLDGPQFVAAFEAMKQTLHGLEADFDAADVHGGKTSAQAQIVLEKLLPAWNQMESDARTVRGYIYQFVSTDAKNELAQAKLSEMEPMFSQAAKLKHRLIAWVGAQDEAALLISPVGKEHAFFIKRCQTLAKHQMSPAEEALTADLTRTGSTAFSRLHGDVTSQIAVDIDLPNGVQTVPMPVCRAFAYDRNRSVRRLAYEAELARWKDYEVPLAAAMNAIKGEVGLLSNRRGWGSPLEAAVYDTNMDLATLDAMLGAAREAFPAFRKYLKAKARAINGEASLDWYDLFAPVGEETTEWQYDQGAAFVSKQFHSYSQRMGEFADRSFRENWIDAQPAAGKRDGAFCMGIRSDESRILMTWKPSFGSVSTLAHELGHGYHNLCLHGRTELQKETPMTLAETASIFCETIISNAAMAEANDAEKISILEQSLQRATQTVVDISSRFLFEQAVFEKRTTRAMSPNELCDMMLWAQGQTYGDGLSENRHPYMWAVKGHYYSGGRSYYNFPYMFGLLFSLGLYAIYKQDPEAFKGSYDDLLSSTGLADAPTLARRFNIDITTSKFWENSLAMIEADENEFDRLVG